MSANDFIRLHWLRRSPVSWALWPFSWVYAGAIGVRRTLYRAGALRVGRLPVPVIVVGNFFVGGTGKTPLVLWLTEQLRAAGFRVGIVSRGHGGAGAIARVERGGDPGRFGDEPLLLAERLDEPVWIGHDRVAAARALLEAHPQVNVIICDDGLQHLALARDIEIALIDERGNGNGWLLPAGPLRERPRRVDALVQRGPAQVPGAFSMRLEPACFVAVAEPRREIDMHALRGKRLHAVAGIGVPERFFATLSELGIAAQPHSFPDHHRFTARELQFVDCDAVLMTEKDAVKCRAFAQPHWYALRVDARIDETLTRRIVSALTPQP